MSPDELDVPVTMPSLPPLEEYMEALRPAWASGILTHNGPLVRELESRLKSRFKIQHLVAMTSGTVALQLAMRALDLLGEVITTPFSWIATCSAIKWERCTPVFADVDEDSFNIDPEQIESRITPRTSAIMPVHVFSNPCDIETIGEIARRNNLRVIYDAAHAFGVTYRQKSILEYGDISATSFHATKLFNTGEGGACVTTNAELASRLQRLRFFGHDDRRSIVDDGLNGKMTEIHAALGLANLPELQAVLDRRREIYLQYREELSSIGWLQFQKIHEDCNNFSYMPVVFDSEARLEKVVAALQTQRIHARRYFRPSLNTVEAVGPNQPCPVSESLSARILCLPSFHQLAQTTISRVCDAIRALDSAG